MPESNSSQTMVKRATKGESLETFLKTHPYKRQNSLKHICSKLNLDQNGTIPILQIRITDDVLKSSDPEKYDKTVRKIALDFARNPNDLTEGEYKQSNETNQITPAKILSPLDINPEQLGGIYVPDNTPTSTYDSSMSDLGVETERSFNSISNDTLTSDQETFETGNDDNDPAPLARGPVQMNELKRKTVTIRDKSQKSNALDESQDIFVVSQTNEHETTIQSVNTQFDEIMLLHARLMRKDEPSACKKDDEMHSLSAAPTKIDAEGKMDDKDGIGGMGDIDCINSIDGITHINGMDGKDDIRGMEDIDGTINLSGKSCTDGIDHISGKNDMDGKNDTDGKNGIGGINDTADGNTGGNADGKADGNTGNTNGNKNGRRADTPTSPGQPHDSCSSKTTGAIECPSGLALKTRFNQIIKQNRNRYCTTVTELAQQKQENRSLQSNIKQQQEKINELQQRQKSNITKSAMVAQDKTIDQLKQMNAKVIQAVNSLTQHNEYLIQELKMEYKTKMEKMEKQHASYKEEKESMVRQLSNAISHLEGNQNNCKCLNHEPLINNIKESQEKTDSSQQIWNAGMMNRVQSIQTGITDLTTTIVEHQSQSNKSNYISNPPTAHPNYDNATREIVLVIHDSNGKELRGNELHHAKQVIMEKRSTADDALHNVPKVTSPTHVTDIVILTGLNDSKSSNETVETTVQKELDIITKYSKCFPNSRFHLGCIPPSSGKQEQINKKLQELANKTAIHFISPEPFYDRTTGILRTGILHDHDRFHYTDLGTRTLAKQIKRSLHSRLDAHHQTNPRNQPLISAPTKRSTIPPLINARIHSVSSPKTTSHPTQNQTLEKLLNGMSQLLSSVQSNLS